jgi:hypothetical protein
VRVLLCRVRLAVFDLGDALPRQAAVDPVLGDAEVDVSAGGIGRTAGNERLDELDDLRDELRDPRHSVRHSKPQRPDVLQIPGRGGIRQSGAGPWRGRVDLVVDVGDVVDERHLVAGFEQP